MSHPNATTPTAKAELSAVTPAAPAASAAQAAQAAQDAQDAQAASAAQAAQAAQAVATEAMQVAAPATPAKALASTKAPDAAPLVPAALVVPAEVAKAPAKAPAKALAKAERELPSVEEADALDPPFSFPIDEDGHRITLAENPEDYEYWWYNGVERWRKCHELKEVVGVIIYIMQDGDVHFGQEDRVDLEKTSKSVWQYFLDQWVCTGKPIHTPYKLDPSIRHYDEWMQLTANIKIKVRDYLFCCLAHALSKGWIYKPLQAMGVDNHTTFDQLHEKLYPVAPAPHPVRGYEEMGKFWQDLFCFFSSVSNHVYWNRVTGAENLSSEEKAALKTVTTADEAWRVILAAAFRAAKEEMHIVTDDPEDPENPQNLVVVDQELVPHDRREGKFTAVVKFQVEGANTLKTLEERQFQQDMVCSQYTSAHKVHKVIAKLFEKGKVTGFDSETFEAKTKAFREVTDPQAMPLQEAKKVLDAKSKRAIEVLENKASRKKQRV